MADLRPVDAQIDAYNARDLERFVACYTADVVIEDAAGETLMQGADGLREAYGPFFAENPNLHGEIVHRIEVGEYVVDEERITGTGDGTLHAVVIYHVAGELIDHVRVISGDDG